MAGGFAEGAERGAGKLADPVAERGFQIDEAGCVAAVTAYQNGLICRRDSYPYGSVI